MHYIQLLILISVFTACCSVYPERPRIGAGLAKRAAASLKAARQGGLFAYVDAGGRVRIPPRYIEAGPFEDGLAVVVTRTVPELGGRFERRFGVIDPAGRYVIPPAFRYISHFREGLAIASLDGKSFGYIDQRGVWVLPPRYAEASDFESGLARVLPLGELSFARVDVSGRVCARP